MAHPEAESQQIDVESPKAREADGARHITIELPDKAVEATPITSSMTRRVMNKMSTLGWTPRGARTPRGEHLNPEKVPTSISSIFQVSKHFFFGESRRCRSWILSLVLLAFMVADNVTSVYFTFILRDAVTALAMKDASGVYGTSRSAFVIILFAMPIVAGSEWVKGGLQLEWRRHTMQFLLNGYLVKSRAYYRLKHSRAGIDNPDQRMCQDVDMFTTNAVLVSTTCLAAFMTAISNSVVLYSIAPGLLWFIIVYTIVGTVFMLRVFGVPLMRLQRHVLSQEATLRYDLVRVRENAEAIAFYQGAQFESTRVQELFSRLLVTLYWRLGVMVGHHSFKRAYTWIIVIAPVLLMFERYAKGEIEMGAISQVQLLFGTLLECLMVLASQLDYISSLGAQAVRILQLKTALEQIAEHEERSAELDCDGIVLQEIPTVEPDEENVLDAEEKGEFVNMCDDKDNKEAPLRLQLDKVTLHPPQLWQSSGVSALCRDVSFALTDGESLLICGDSGIGKSSLLRAIGGLWTDGSGRIDRCPAKECFFVPQQPYMCLGTLREQATYPAGEATDDEIAEALASVNLGHLIARHGLDNRMDFSSTLSLGEQQRLGFARLLLRKNVSLALLDEATSALDEENEAKLYGLLSQHVRCFVSVAHRPLLHKFHTHRLRLTRLPGGGCMGDLQLTSSGVGSP